MNYINNIKYLLKLIQHVRYTVLIVFFLFNGLAFVLYKSIDKNYFTDIRVTSIPNKDLGYESSDIFSLYELLFRNNENFLKWKQNYKDSKLLFDDISSYSEKNDRIVPNKVLVFRNATTFNRSIYITISANRDYLIKDFFNYSLFIANILNDNLNEKLNSKILNNLVTPDFQTTYSFQLPSNLSNANYDEIINFLRSSSQMSQKDIENKLETIKNILNDDKLKAFKSSENHIIVNPPSNAYTTSAELSTYFYISFFSSILCVCLLLIAKDDKFKFRKSSKVIKL